MNENTIAIVGLACIYPDAPTPEALWENVLSQRRAFRRIPDGRMNLADYHSPDRNNPDKTYSTEAAVINNYKYDRLQFRTSGKTFRATDMTHWLALDVAAQVLADAGFPLGEGLPKEETGVFIGNTLTGEFSRSNVMRIRWPYVRRTLDASLAAEGWDAEQRAIFLQKMEATYKAPFPAFNEESLAGGLSNTIAGRICNYFDFKGGGYTLDGACSSSLLAMINACTALTMGDVDVALAGGVDLSIDPFEIIGFAKTNALAEHEMRVYDAESEGFWPGEGCGIVMLMRYEDALVQGCRIYATIKGWGISSDGSGGITRPEVDGQMLALKRAYKRAGFGIDTLAYFEGHGTGTVVGDAVELRSLSTLRHQSNPGAPQAVIGTIKGNFGHTKAAAGIAGLIKATLVAYHQILPPTTGHSKIHPELDQPNASLRTSRQGEVWSGERPLRTAVSAMGFGGINTHIVLEAENSCPREQLTAQEQQLLASPQDAELILLSAADTNDLRAQIEQLQTFAGQLSRSELTDLAATLAKQTNPQHSTRAALVVSTPQKLKQSLNTVLTWIHAEIETRLDSEIGIFLNCKNTAVNIGYLFPGQAAPVYADGGAWARRFPFVADLYQQQDFGNSPTVVTEVAQPAILLATVAGLRLLDQLSLTAVVGVGHSLGELAAWHWAGVMDQAQLLRIGQRRGKVMGDLGAANGAMASLAINPQELNGLLTPPAVVACENGPQQTVIAGPQTTVAGIVSRANARGIRAVQLPVSHAFHSPLVAKSAAPFANFLESETFQPAKRQVVSTITGEPLAKQSDFRGLLQQQITSPVQFTQAMDQAGEKVDLWIEVGPGKILASLVARFRSEPVISLDVGGVSLRGLLQAVGAAFALGKPINHKLLFNDRFARPLDMDWQPNFFVNPCELAPNSTTPVLEQTELALLEPFLEEVQPNSNGKVVATDDGEEPLSALETVRQVVVERIELPASAIGDQDSLLGDLHLNSLAVSQIVVEAAKRLGAPAPLAPTEYANATVADMALALEAQLELGFTLESGVEQPISGVDSWVHAFQIGFHERSLPNRKANTGSGFWQIVASPGHPLLPQLQAAVSGKASGGVIVCLPESVSKITIDMLLDGARLFLAKVADNIQFVLVQQDRVGAGLARSLHQEYPQTTTQVINLPYDHPQALEWIVAEIETAVGYSEVYYDTDGRRCERELELLSLPADTPATGLNSDDVLLITGGGKGITAECALDLARETGAKLALVGRSHPKDNDELSNNLNRFTAEGIRFAYYAADVTDADEVKLLIDQVVKDLGPVTGILHGAARNVPAPLAGLDEAELQRTLAPKVTGISHILAAIDPDQLRFFISFGSIIAVAGLRGESHYAVANEWLTQITRQWQAEHPDCCCIALEWSVWAGAGMGERLGTLDALQQQGITPIPIREGVASLRRLLGLRQDGLVPVSVVVTSRYGQAPTLMQAKPELPFYRFLEKPRLYYPQIELVSDVELSPESDPYLDDHVFRGDRVFPAVMGLESMAQLSMALLETAVVPYFESLEFNRPIVVSGQESLTLRIAALRLDAHSVEVVLRSQETAFQVDHFRGICRFDAVETAVPTLSAQQQQQLPALSATPEDLYEEFLFHQGRFQRLQAYYRLRAQSCQATITTDNKTAWFGRYHPQTLVLGDPGARDAAIHVNQASVPHISLLPVRVERLITGQSDRSETLSVFTEERARDDETFTYDVEVCQSDGRLLEHWQGLTLQGVKGSDFAGQWPAPFLAPYIEHKMMQIAPEANLSIALLVAKEVADVARQERSDTTVALALGEPVTVTRRPDGKPEVMGLAQHISTAHSDRLTLAVSSCQPVACDMEFVSKTGTDSWLDVLGAERFALANLIAEQTNEEIETAVTRVWTAVECLQKAEAIVDTPLNLTTTAEDGWVTLTAGAFKIATYLAHVKSVDRLLVTAVLVEEVTCKEEA